MKNNVELLKMLLEKIKNTPDSIIEKAIDDLSEELIIYNISIEYINNDIESENKEWNENLQLAA